MTKLVDKLQGILSKSKVKRFSHNWSVIGKFYRKEGPSFQTPNANLAHTGATDSRITLRFFMSTAHPNSSPKGSRQPMIMSSESISLCVSLWISGEIVT